MHIARIDRRYVLVWPGRERLLNTTTMEAAIDIALAELASIT
jgi:hypothetical protein